MTSGSIPRPAGEPASTPEIDALGRSLRDLRVSVTDRCNMRCRYCMPREVFGPGFAFLPRSELLSFEEITTAVEAFARAGVRKVRLTGGEPLLRHGLTDLVAMLAGVASLDDLALTTNGSVLARYAAPLRAAGLKRVTVSLDSLDPAVFAAMGDTEIPLHAVLDGIEAAVDAGFAPVKLNTVVKRGVNDDGLVDLAGFARERGHVARFIEYMDVGSTNGWRLDDVVPAAEILRRIGEVWPLEPVPPRYPGEVATRFRYADGGGEVGVIASVSQPFCGSCTRARLTAIGEFFTCLFASRGVDLRAVLRGGAEGDELARLMDDAVRGTWRSRRDRYSELRASGNAGGQSPGRHAEMSYLGG